MNPPSGTRRYDPQAVDAARFIRSRSPEPPRVGIILGTGSGELADQIVAPIAIPYSQVPHLPVSTAIGHKGQWVSGRLADQPVIAMQGRFHLYEGYSVESATLPVRAMSELGVQLLIVTNAAGGIHPRMNRGDLMLIDSHIDLMFRRASLTVTTTVSRPRLRTDVYDQAMIDRALACARQNGFAARRGVYAAMLGPNYETRAEIRMLRRIGADAAGMSTVPEVVQAAQAGLRVLAISVITNLANPDSAEQASGIEVVEEAQQAGPAVAATVIDAIRGLDS